MHLSRPSTFTKRFQDPIDLMMQQYILVRQSHAYSQKVTFVGVQQSLV
jgi:hypothetical protein